MIIITYKYGSERREHIIETAPDEKQQMKELIKELEKIPGVKGITVTEK